MKADQLIGYQGELLSYQRTVDFNSSPRSPVASTSRFPATLHGMACAVLTSTASMVPSSFRCHGPTKRHPNFSRTRLTHFQLMDTSEKLPDVLQRDVWSCCWPISVPRLIILMICWEHKGTNSIRHKSAPKTKATGPTVKLPTV